MYNKRSRTEIHNDPDNNNNYHNDTNEPSSQDPNGIIDLDPPVGSIVEDLCPPRRYIPVPGPGKLQLVYYIKGIPNVMNSQENADIVYRKYSGMEPFMDPEKIIRSEDTIMTFWFWTLDGKIMKTDHYRRHKPCGKARSVYVKCYDKLVILSHTLVSNKNGSVIEAVHFGNQLGYDHFRLDPDCPTVYCHPCL